MFPRTDVSKGRCFHKRTDISKKGPMFPRMMFPRDDVSKGRFFDKKTYVSKGRCFHKRIDVFRDRCFQELMFPTTDVPRTDIFKGRCFHKRTAVSKDRCFQRPMLSHLLIYQLFSFDFGFVYDCFVCGRVSLGITLTVLWKHLSLETSALGNIG